MDRLDKI